MEQGLLIVRDHSLPCEHNDAWRENLDWLVWKCGIKQCPGGREVVLRRESVWFEADDGTESAKVKVWVENGT